MLKTKALALVAVTAVACGTAQGIEEPISSNAILVRTTRGIEAVSLGTGQVQRRIPEGIVSVGADRVVSTTTDGTSTRVTTMDLAGEVLSRATLEGNMVARVATNELVALTDRAGAGETAYLPAPKERTRVVVLDSDGTQREFELEGNFEPEAFKVSGTELFMIEYIPAMAPDRYQVRRLKLRSGAVVPIGRFKSNAPDQMQGTGRTQVLAPAGHELYTLYTQQPDAGHAGDAHAHGISHAFVHVLNLDQSWAHCVDLPSVFASGRATASAIAVNPSGSRVFVADWTSGSVASLIPRKVRVAKTVTGLELGSEDDETFAAASSDQLYIAGNDAIVVLDASTLSIIDRWSIGAEVVGLELDDERLFVSTAGSVIVLDPINGRSLQSVPVDGTLGIEGVVLDD